MQCIWGDPQFYFFDGAEKMGVKIEIFRMMVYLSFPVTMFWISNQAEYFEEYIVKRKREIFPPDEKMQRKELEEFKERMRVRREQKMLKQLAMEEKDQS
ncbi:protein PET100 homolog, mitochondrial [Silurus meridionalis]|nr:protein PET100 homolog, mitochondrial [Silurus meridionalis]